MSKRNKYIYISIDEFSEKIKSALSHFRSSFDLGNESFEIKYLRDDAIFIQLHGIINAYSIARFINNSQNFYIEIDPIAPKYIELRIFCSDFFIENEIPRQNRRLTRDFNLDNRSYKIRILEKYAPRR